MTTVFIRSSDGATTSITIPDPTVIPSGAITNGKQLTTSMVGPAAIGAGTLKTLANPSRGYFRGDTPTEFVPSGNYVVNNSPTNHGGTVPAGGLVIDGYNVPAGTFVCQFFDFSINNFYLSNSSNYYFRGCKFRAPGDAPGWFNCATSNTGKLYIMYCDLGGLGSASANFCEVPIDIQNGSGLIAYRNRISFVTTGIQCEVNNSELVENYITDLTDFGNGTSHLNGITVNGGQKNMLVLRNYIVVQKLDTSGRQIGQTDCLSFFQDFGSFVGTGTNRDGSVGFKVDNNYVGGTGYCFYAGLNAGKGASTVTNMQFTNNLITTQAYSTGGNFGVCAAQPNWGSNGNVASNNRWADGGSAGQIAFGS